MLFWFRGTSEAQRGHLGICPSDHSKSARPHRFQALKGFHFTEFIQHRAIQSHGKGRELNAECAHELSSTHRLNVA